MNTTLTKIGASKDVRKHIESFLPPPCDVASKDYTRCRPPFSYTRPDGRRINCKDVCMSNLRAWLGTLLGSVPNTVDIGTAADTLTFHRWKPREPEKNMVKILGYKKAYEDRNPNTEYEPGKISIVDMKSIAGGDVHLSYYPYGGKHQGVAFVVNFLQENAKYLKKITIELPIHTYLTDVEFDEFNEESEITFSGDNAERWNRYVDHIQVERGPSHLKAIFVIPQ